MVTDTDTWVEIREPHTDKLLFKYDPERGIIEIQRRGQRHVIDLRSYGLEVAVKKEPEHKTTKLTELLGKMVARIDYTHLYELRLDMVDGTQLVVRPSGPYNPDVILDVIVVPEGVTVPIVLG